MKLLLLLILPAIISGHSFDAIRVKQASRQVTLKGHTEEVVTQYNLENTGKSAQNEFFFAIHPTQTKHLAYFHASTVSGSTSSVLEVKEASHPEGPKGTKFLKASLPTALAPGGTTVVQSLSIFTHTLAPFPAEIRQGEPQFVKYSGNAVVFTPYEVESQATKYELPSPKVLSHTKQNVAANGDTLDAGPYQKTEPFTFEDFEAHYEQPNPFVTMKTLVREIEISHWGNVAVEETYHLVHDGAKLNGAFSRLDYQRRPTPGSYRQINGLLPKNAYGIYYRDQIGNISTSHVRESEDALLLELQPRFPMFGGWEVDFYIGYNLPASDVLSVDRTTGKYVLNTTFGSSFPAAAVDHLEVRVILPEGASNIEWATLFDVDSTQNSNRVTYFDTHGRPVLILKKDNVVRHHNQPFFVSYSFSSTLLLREPLMIFTAYLLFFVLAAVFQRFELTISPSFVAPSHSSRSSTKTRVATVLACHTDIRHLYESSASFEATQAQTQSLLETLRAASEQLRKDAGFTSAGEIYELHIRLRDAARRVKKNKEGAKARYDELVEALQRSVNVLVRK